MVVSLTGAKRKVPVRLCFAQNMSDVPSPMFQIRRPGTFLFTPLPCHISFHSCPEVIYMKVQQRS
mgnify:CR=1 FL=1